MLRGVKSNEGPPACVHEVAEGHVVVLTVHVYYTCGINRHGYF